MDGFKHVQAIGIEFEGYWKDLDFTYPKLQEIVDVEGKNDGSLGSSYPYAQSREIITVPISRSVTLRRLLKAMEEERLEKRYIIDNTVGLHFHLSLPKNFYAGIITEDFVTGWIELFKKIDPDSYNVRSQNKRYCDPRPYLGWDSGSRYTMVNYNWNRHGTVEFRGYGGCHATFQKMEDLVFKTMEYVDAECEKRRLIAEEDISLEFQERTGMVLDDSTAPYDGLTSVTLVYGTNLFERYYAETSAYCRTYEGVTNFRAREALGKLSSSKRGDELNLPIGKWITPSLRYELKSFGATNIIKFDL